MNVSFNVSTPTITPSSVSGPEQTQQTSRSNPTLTVTITNGAPGAEGAGGPGAITLSYPLIGPEDIAINEFLQQMASLDLNQLQGMTMTAAVLMLNQQVGELGQSIVKGGLKYIEDNAKQLGEMFDNIEKQAAQAETQLYDLIANSTYPEFTAFLSKMLVAAQELRQLASEAKMNLVMGEYQNILDQADYMMTAAQKNYDSTIKTLEAEKTEAIGKIVSGAVSLVASAGGAIGGASLLKGPGTTAAAGAAQGAQIGGAFGSAAGGIIDGSFALAANAKKVDAANLKLEADVADVGRKRLEASQKLLQEGQGIAAELKDLAKTLADMVLKLYQDFMSSQQQVLQRANI